MIRLINNILSNVPPTTRHGLIARGCIKLVAVAYCTGKNRNDGDSAYNGILNEREDYINKIKLGR